MNESKGEKTRHIYVECTYTFFHGGTSGIRRVARNLANYGPLASPQGTEIRPVVWAGIGFFSPNRRLTEKTHPLLHLLYFLERVLMRIAGYTTSSISFLCRPLPESIRKLMHQIWRRVFSNVERKANADVIYCLLGVFSFPMQMIVGRAIRLIQGDTIVLVDSTWNSPRMREHLVIARQTKQIYLGVMIHDLFSLTIPETCQQQTIEGFSIWFHELVAHVDFFVTNSESTRRELQAYLKQNPEIRPYGFRSGSFPLGAELDMLQEGIPSDDVMSIWDTPGTAIITLGTIEPRKNHNVLLDAFDILSERNHQVTLLIVGRYGWKCDEVLERIKAHPQLNHRLIHLSEASDADIQQALSRASCMVCPSLAEGFGLPVAEGLAHGLKVFASDIPVFREVNVDACTYFSPHDPIELADLLENWIFKYERGEQPSPPAPLDWPDWQESTRRFGELVLQLLPAS